MKYLKLYEEIHKYKPTPKPQVNDWVLAIDTNFTNDIENSEQLTKYVRTHVGQVVRYKSATIHVKYYDLNSNILDHFRSHFPEFVDFPNNSAEVELIPEEITYWSNNEKEMKAEAEVILTSNKYNL